MEPPPKKVKRDIRIHSLFKSDAKSEDVDIHSMENGSKVTFPCKFIERFPIKEKVTSTIKGYSYLLQCLSEIDVEIPMMYSNKNDKSLMNSLKAVQSNLEFRAEKDVEPLVLRPAELFRVTDFTATESDYGFDINKVVLLTDAHLRVQFEIKHDENIDRPYEERCMIGDPYVQIMGLVKMQMDRDLSHFYNVLKKSPTHKEIIARFQSFKIPQIPVESRVEGLYDAFVNRVTNKECASSTVSMPGINPKPAGMFGNIDNMKTPYNFTVIPTRILYERKRPPFGFWAHLDNTITKYMEMRYDINVEEGDHFPFISFHPPLKNCADNSDTMKRSNYHWTETSTEKKRAVLSSDNDSIVGYIQKEGKENEDEYNLSANKIYDVESMFGFSHALTWSNTGPIIAKGMTGLAFFLINEVQKTSVLNSPINKFCLSGKIFIYLDPVHTFTNVGLKVSKQFVIEYIKSQFLVKSKEHKPDANVHHQLNPFSKQFTISDGKYKPRFINIKEFNSTLKDDDQDIINEKEWDFFMIPPDNILYDSLGESKVENPVNSSQVLKYLNFVFHNEYGQNKEREDKITNEWYSNALMKPYISVMAVLKSYKGWVQHETSAMTYESQTLPAE